MCQHRVSLSDDKSKLQVFRLGGDNVEYFLSELKLEELKVDFDKAALWLGELILLDCPETRRAFDGETSA